MSLVVLFSLMYAELMFGLLYIDNPRNSILMSFITERNLQCVQT